ncbi:MAG TPA: fatty acid--CoA ligase [Mycobacteriales bacterium]|nr:fatty acid--CoA ligase [Mycobacteriales bacterium]
MRSTMQDRPLTVASILRHGAAVFSDSSVVTAGEDGSRRASFGDVAERSHRLANALTSLGVKGDARVGTFMWNNQEHLEAYLAIPSMGAVLHTLNIRLFPEQVVYIANHAEDEVVIVDSSLIPLLARVLPEMKSVRAVLVAGDGDTSPLESAGKEIVRYDEALAAASTSYEWPDVDETSAAAMCYTSGTTGNPKGVAYSHRSMWLHSLAATTTNTLALGFQDIALVIVPQFHANAWGIPYAAFMAGADVIMPDRFLQAEPLVRIIETEKPTMSGAVPTIWNDILTYLRANPGHDISSLQRIICGGSAVPRALMEAFHNEFGITIIQAWGMTETSPLGSVARTPRGLSEEAAWDYRTTAGRLTFGVEGRVVDDEGKVLPQDGKAVGEVEVRGPWVTGAYYLDDDPEKFDNGWLRTGDVGTIDPRGYITLTDRAKDVIKSGGEWISSVELESTLMAHPAVREAAVVGVPDDRWQERPLAAVVVKEGESVTAQELCDWLSERVAKWWLPERWTFIQEVPRTSVGKFDKKVIRKEYADGDLTVEELG